MNSDLVVVMDRNEVDIDLLRTADDSLPRVVRYLNTCLPFAGKVDGETVAVCLVEDKGIDGDIVNLAVKYEKQHMGYGRAMLSYVLNHLTENGKMYVYTGCGNSDIRLMTFFQRAGFRFYEVWQDHFIGDSKIATVENSIIRRDMVRFRKDLNEKTMETTGYDASGRT